MTLSACETSERKMAERKQGASGSELSFDGKRYVHTTHVRDAQKFASALCQNGSTTSVVHRKTVEHECQVKAPTQMLHNSAQMGHGEVNVVCKRSCHRVTYGKSLIHMWVCGCGLDSCTLYMCLLVCVYTSELPFGCWSWNGLLNFRFGDKLQQFI